MLSKMVPLDAVRKRAGATSVVRERESWPPAPGKWGPAVSAGAPASPVRL